MEYIDTSIVTAYYCPEPLSAKADAALRGSNRPCISRLTEIELMSAIAKKVRAREMSRRSAHDVIELFGAHVADGLYRFAQIGEHEYSRASGWVGRLDVPLRTLDALHLAIARSGDLMMITSDRQMANAASRLEIPHRLIS